MPTRDASSTSQPLADDYAIVYQDHEATSPRGLDGPGIVKLPDGNLLSVVPAKMATEHWAVHVMESGDGGETWQHIAELAYYTAVPFIHDERVYLVAQTEAEEGRIDEVQLIQSDDGGHSWSDPTTIAEGDLWNVQTGMVRHDGYLYWAIDDLEPGPNYRGHRILAGDLSADVMNSSAWRLSNVIQFPGLPPSVTNIDIKQFGNRMLEPNVIEVNGTLRVLSCVKPPGQATTNLAAVFDIQDDGSELELEFTQYHPFPGGQVKFAITKDDQTGYFWATVNQPVDGQNQFALEDPDEHRRGEPYGRQSGGNDRRFLMLYYGLDGLNWFPAGCIARAPRLKQSFMYPAPLIDDADLLVVARSNIDGPNRHDADSATFHRITDFRELAMELRQDIE